MKKRIILKLFLGFFLFILIGTFLPVKRVAEGKRTVCEDCGKIILQSIRQIRIPWFVSSNKYKIIENKGLCLQCADKNIEVETGYIVRCKRCKKVIEKNVQTKRVKRRDKDEYHIKYRNIICNSCKRQAEKKERERRERKAYTCSKCGRYMKGDPVVFSMNPPICSRCGEKILNKFFDSQNK